MVRLMIVVVLLSVVITACGSDADTPTEAPQIPTLRQANTPTPEPTQTAPPTPSATATDTPTATATATPIPTETETAIPTNTLPSTATFTPSATPTFYFSATTVGNVPAFATLTPAPAGQTIPQTAPLLAADIVITERDFQAEVSNRLNTTPSIQSAAINFVPGPDQGISVRMSASGGQAMISGDVFIAFAMSGGFVRIAVTRIDVASGGDPPEPFVTVIAEELYPLITDTFSSLIDNALGQDHDLEVLRFSNNAMEIKLLVPEANTQP